MLPSFKYLKELYYALAIIIAIFVVGIIGFMLIEGYDFSEALYMTVITVSTVGFKEVRELTVEGRYFTIMLILVSFGTFAYTLSSVSKYVMTGTFKRYYKKYKMDSAIKKLEGHVVLCGAGRNGMEALQNLLSHGRKVVVVEQKNEIIDHMHDEGIYHIEGDATEEKALLSAGVKRASALITSLPRDTDNVFVVLTARELNPDIRIVSRCASDSSESKLKIAGADNIIMPDKVGGARMAGFIINHNINRFIDTVSLKEGNDVYLKENAADEIRVDGEKTVGNILSTLDTSCKIVGVMSPDFEYVVNPDHDYEIPENSRIFFFGKPDEIKSLTEKL